MGFKSDFYDFFYFYKFLFKNLSVRNKYNSYGVIYVFSKEGVNTSKNNGPFHNVF